MKLRHGNCHSNGHMIKQIRTPTFGQTNIQHMKLHSSALLNKIVIFFTDLKSYNEQKRTWDVWTNVLCFADLLRLAINHL